MPASEAYDVVVVRDPTMTVGRMRTLSRDLAHLTGLEQGDVEFALQKGRFVVYPALASGRVDAATEQLRKIGAVVQLKPADAPRVERLEPATVRSGARSFDGPVTAFADADLGMDSSAFNTGPGVAPAAERGVGIGHVLPTDERSVEVPPHPAGADMQDLADGLDAAAFDEPTIQTIDGMDGATFEAAEIAAQRQVVPEPPPRPPEHDARLEIEQPPPAASSSQMGPGPEPSLELARLQQSASSLPPPSMTQAAYSSGSRPMAGASTASMSRPDMRAEEREESGLLFADPIGNTLGLIAACTLVCLVAAVAVTRSTKQDALRELEEELAQSHGSPSDVEFGRMRAPELILEDLDELYGSARKQFLLVLAVGIPLGLGLSRIRR